MLISCTIRDGAIRVRGVVVVGVAGGVDIPCIVGIATVGGTQTAVLSTTYIPNLFL